MTQKPKPSCPECGTEVKAPGLCAACKNRIAREITARTDRLSEDRKHKGKGRK